MTLNYKVVVFSILSIYLVQLFWIGLYQVSCVSIVFPLMILLVIASSLLQIKMQQRLCYRDCFFKSDTFISNFLSSRFVSYCLSLIYAFILSVSLSYMALSYPAAFWLYLFFHIILTYLILYKARHLLANKIKERKLSFFSKELAIKISSVFLFTVFFILFIFGYEPEYLSNSLEKTMQNATLVYSSSCTIIDSALRLKAELDGLSWWLISQVSKDSYAGSLSSWIWVFFFIINCLSILGLNRLVAQTISIVNKGLIKKDSENE